VCLIFVAHECHEDYRLIVAANRDEFHERPALSADFWRDDSATADILAGRDLEAGGTWMGITRQGKFGALTNFRDPENNRLGAPSRGSLVRDFLEHECTAESYCARLPGSATKYNGFSLLIGDSESLNFYSNRNDRLEPVAPGVHGLSNHLLDTPWPKVERGRRVLSAHIEQGREVDVELMFDMMADRLSPDDGALPDTGVGIQKERELAPMFIHGSVYGTRCTAVVLMDRAGGIYFEERSFDSAGNESGRKVHEFSTVAGQAGVALSGAND
jgi:uncharacterized protein with NRDE domain